MTSSAAGQPETRVLFVSGFHRSGTTLAATAVTAATGGTTLTVGHLADRIPSVAAFLAATRDAPADRGVDRVTVTAATPEEYGWLLYQAAGRRALSERDVRGGILRELVAAIGGAGPVVLKNPWDTGREDRLLRSVDNSSVLLVRRNLAAIEASLRRALLRYVGSNAYLRALRSDDRGVRMTLRTLANPIGSRAILFVSRWVLRCKVVRLAGRVGGLPADRVAFVSYDELTDDPAAGAAWAAHLLPAANLAAAFGTWVFVDAGAPRPGGWLVRALDARWARAWERARAAQVAAGVLPPP